MVLPCGFKSRLRHHLNHNTSGYHPLVFVLLCTIGCANPYSDIEPDQYFVSGRGDIMNGFAVWLFLAMVMERSVELVVRIVPGLNSRKLWGLSVPALVAFLFSLVLAYGANLDFFALFEFEFEWDFLGPFFSALFMTGGSSLLHDLMEWVRASKEGQQVLNGKGSK
jgi:hypothetical protein